MKKVITKYENRKMYDKSISAYINLKELVVQPLDSFQVVEKKTGIDITLETLFEYIASAQEANETKVRVMEHCIKVLSQEVM